MFYSDVPVFAAILTLLPAFCSVRKGVKTNGPAAGLNAAGPSIGIRGGLADEDAGGLAGDVDQVDTGGQGKGKGAGGGAGVVELAVGAGYHHGLTVETVYAEFAVKTEDFRSGGCLDGADSRGIYFAGSLTE